MTEFSDDSLKWLEGMDLTEHQFAGFEPAENMPWTDTAANQDFPWEATLTEDAANTTKFLLKLAREVESNKKT